MDRSKVHFSLFVFQFCEIIAIVSVTREVHSRKERMSLSLFGSTGAEGGSRALEREPGWTSLSLIPLTTVTTAHGFVKSSTSKLLCLKYLI